MGCLEDSKKCHQPGRPKTWLKCLTPYAVGLGVLVAITTIFHATPFQPSPALIGASGGRYFGHSFLPPHLGWVAFLFPSMGQVDATICRAEANYWENLDHRREAFGGDLQPMLGNPVRMKELVLIPTYTCPLNERIGKWGDGGKWACMMPSVIQKKDPVVYSIGSYGMYSFEKEMSTMLRSKPYTFDPFLPPRTRNLMASLPFLHFIETGLSGNASLAGYRSQFPAKKFLTLPAVMEELGHTYVDVFKIDCEGCEVEFLKDLGEAYNNTGKQLAVHGGKLPFGQILIEFHNMNDPTKTLTMFYTLENLGYRMFSIEYNHHCDPCCEMSFIHESLVRPDSATDCRPFLTAPVDEEEEGEGDVVNGVYLAAGDVAADDGAAAAAAATAAAATAAAGDAGDGADAGAAAAGDGAAGADSGAADDGAAAAAAAPAAGGGGATESEDAVKPESKASADESAGESSEIGGDSKEGEDKEVEVKESGVKKGETKESETTESEGSEGEGETKSAVVSGSRKARAGAVEGKKSTKVSEEESEEEEEEEESPKATKTVGKGSKGTKAKVFKGKKVKTVKEDEEEE